VLEAVEWTPELAVLSLDIETDDKASQVYAVSLVGQGPQLRHQVAQVHLVGEGLPEDPHAAICYADERAMLVGVEARIKAIDPDVLTGWNVIDFDMAVLQKRSQACGLAFNWGRSQDEGQYLEGKRWGGSRMVVRGRQVVDALHIVRTALPRFEDYRLDTVARALLERGKTLAPEDEESMPEAIERAYRSDRNAFCAYVLEDARLVLDILAAEKLMGLTLSKSLLTGMPLERCWGSVAAFELLYMGQLHCRRIVAPTRGVDQQGDAGSPGGLVLAPQAGLYRHVWGMDFKSLYPSIIRTFNIDPLAYEQGKLAAEEDVVRCPNGTSFAREKGILPELLERFWAKREAAKADQDSVAAYAYKIVMNSFYGVLCTDSCRFAASHFASAITEAGHMILTRTRDRLEALGYRVLYGDTDSVFVASGLATDASLDVALEKGIALCAEVNAELKVYIESTFGVESALELEFEKYYRRFLLPPARGASGRGRAKGYAGLRQDASGARLEIIGMEAVRRDWTRLAHQLQRELLTRIFNDEPAALLEGCVADWVKAVRQGRKDADLVYHKGLRKSVESYTRSSPPHVKAARLLARPSGVIHYVMTHEGPQPVGHLSAAIDYRHYIDKQVAPIVGTLAAVCDLDLDAALRGAPSLFSGTGIKF